MTGAPPTTAAWTRWLGPGLLIAIALVWLDVCLDVGRHLGVARNSSYQGVFFSVAGLAVVALGWQARALTSRVHRVFLGVLLAALVASSLTSQSHQLRSIGTSSQVQLWGVFHYYLGAKYFDELGYHGLYEQTLVADKESTRRLLKVQLVRNLSTYQREKASRYRDLPRSAAWTDARWEEFKKDLGWFLERRDPVFWANIIVDRGYNPSPAWHAIGSTLVAHLRVDVRWQ